MIVGKRTVLEMVPEKSGAIHCYNDPTETSGHSKGFLQRGTIPENVAGFLALDDSSGRQSAGLEPGHEFVDRLIEVAFPLLPRTGNTNVGHNGHVGLVE